MSPECGACSPRPPLTRSPSFTHPCWTSGGGRAFFRAAHCRRSLPGGPVATGLPGPGRRVPHHAPPPSRRQVGRCQRVGGSRGAGRRFIPEWRVSPRSVLSAHPSRPLTVPKVPDPWCGVPRPQVPAGNGGGLQEGPQVLSGAHSGLGTGEAARCRWPHPTAAQSVQRLRPAPTRHWCRQKPGACSQQGGPWHV